LDPFNNFSLCYDVLNTNCEASVDKPVVHNKLDVGNDVAACLGSQVFPDDVNQTSVRVANNFLSHNA
jgi:hypothetical protein